MSQAPDLEQFRSHGQLPRALRYLESTRMAIHDCVTDFDQLNDVADMAASLRFQRRVEPEAGREIRYSGRSHFELSLTEAFCRSGTTLEISGCSDFRLSFSGRVSADLPVACREKFFISIRDCRRFDVQGLTFREGRNQLFIDNSAEFQLQDCGFSHAEGYGLTLLNCRRFRVLKCRFERCLASGLMALGDTHTGLMTGNYFNASRGDYNWDAALHLCATTEHVGAGQIPEHCHENESMELKICKPRHIVVSDCVFVNSRAQGIYLEGAINCLLQRNLICGNNKEGICFDWGSSCNLFLDNDVIANGERASMTESSIRADFLQDYALLPDNSSSMKLPGVSLDNAFLNKFEGNRIDRNYGGGVKMVRSAQGNEFYRNRIADNVLGKNQHIPHVNGFSMLCLGVLGEFSQDTKAHLDFVPSARNLLRGNTISGHSCEVFQDPLCFDNEIDSLPDAAD